MKKIIIFNGSPRRNGNSAAMFQKFKEGAENAGALTETINTHELDLKYCTGCLRCNILKRCSLTGDEWQTISEKILEADVVVFASPVYFHHVTAPVKIMIDRFRSFIHVQITETGLKHTPHHTWKKDFVLLLSMGSSDNTDAEPVIDLFGFMTEMLGDGNALHVIEATRLAVVNQVLKNEQELKALYSKLLIPGYLAEADHLKNIQTLEDCYRLGHSLSKE